MIFKIKPCTKAANFIKPFIFLKWICAISLSFLLLCHITSISAAVDTLNIGTADELLQFAQDVNNGNTYANTTVFLTNDIDISSISNWPAIGYTISRYFGGEFDGQGHTISGLTISGRKTQMTEVGLFGTIKGATIKNLNVETSDTGVNATYSVGAVIGYIADNTAGQTTLIDNVHAKGNVTGSSYSVGVLIGKIEVDKQNTSVVIQNCSSEGSATSTNSGYVGGLIGHAYYKSTKGGTFYIGNCQSNVNVSSKTNYAGGFVGILENNYATANAVVEKCIAKGSVTNTGAYTGGFTSEIRNFSVRYCDVLSYSVNGKGSYVGGFVGFVDNIANYSRNSEIYNCSVALERPLTVTGGTSYVGGFVGHALYIQITNCNVGGYNRPQILPMSTLSGTGIKVNSVEVKGGSTYCGGFAGVLTKCIVDKCSSFANATSPNYCVGGFAGYLEGKNSISNCYAIGDASSTSGGNENNVGGFAGSASEASILNCYSSGTVYGARKTAPYQGAFIGHVYPNTTLDNCYYDIETTYGIDPYGIGSQYIKGTLNGVTTDQIYALLGLR